jgi:hypothetical protein
MSSQAHTKTERLADPLAAWKPPARPEWVQRINDEGRWMDIRAVVPLDADSLLISAQHNTGLSDFGEDSWREPYTIITKAFDDEANLNLMGRLMCRSDMLHFLEGRLLIEESYRRHPEIENERISKPFFIVGQGRSGTSALLNVMAKDPDNGAVKTWEAIFPCPPPEKATYSTDPRIERGDALITQWNRVNPAFESLHEFAGEVPASCVHFLTFAFMSIWFNQLGQMPSYSRYCAQADWHKAFEYHKRVLKLLQWKNPRKHWILKSPTHLKMMPTILDVYPDACFVWPHRDPIKAIVSSVDLAGNMIWARSDDNRMLGFEEYNRPERAIGMLEQPIEWIESGRVPRERVCSINYVDFIADPVRTVQRIYGYFDVEFTDRAKAAMDEYMRDSPRSARPTHSYNDDVKQAIAKERAVFSRYQKYFQVPTEP